MLVDEISSWSMSFGKEELDYPAWGAVRCLDRFLGWPDPAYLFLVAGGTKDLHWICISSICPDLLT